jgi:hypothetical protein
MFKFKFMFMFMFMFKYTLARLHRREGDGFA